LPEYVANCTPRHRLQLTRRASRCLILFQIAGCPWGTKPVNGAQAVTITCHSLYWCCSLFCFCFFAGSRLVGPACARAAVDNSALLLPMQLSLSVRRLQLRSSRSGKRIHCIAFVLRGRLAARRQQATAVLSDLSHGLGACAVWPQQPLLCRRSFPEQRCLFRRVSNLVRNACPWAPAVDQRGRTLR